MINREFKVGDSVSRTELEEIQLIPVDKTNPLPDNTPIARVSLIDLGREYRAVHYGGTTGKMHKDRGNNALPETAKVVAIYKPK